MGFILDKETAEFEFNRICEAWEIDNGDNISNDEDKADFEKLKNQIVTAIQKGRLVLNDDDNLEYTISDKSKTKSGQKLTITMPVGETYIAMLKKNKDKILYAALGQMTNHAIEWFVDVSAVDLKPLHAIVNLFLAS